MSTVSEAYQCSDCGEWWDIEEDAVECCAPRVIHGYKCDACGDYHVLKANAENCCEFQCRECGEWNIEAADICEQCGHDTSCDPIPPSVLEKFGQYRLPL